MEKKLEKLEDKKLALRMSKYISSLESIRVRAEYYSAGSVPEKEMKELADDYEKVRASIRNDSEYLSFNKGAGSALLRDKYAPSVIEAAVWGLYADPKVFDKDYFKSIDDALERLTKYYPYDYWQIIAEL